MPLKNTKLSLICLVCGLIFVFYYSQMRHSHDGCLKNPPGIALQKFKKQSVQNVRKVKKYQSNKNVMSQAQKFSTDETSSATEFSTYNTTSPATEPIIFDEIKPVMSSINVIVKSAIRKPQIKQVSLKSGAAISNRINKTLTKNMIFKGITFERLVNKRDVYIHIMNKQVETGKYSIIDPKHLEDFIPNTKNVNFTNE